jgi:hypothetical protein
MSSSPYRQRIEIPAELHHRLREQADALNIPIARWATILLRAGADGYEHNRAEVTAALAGVLAPRKAKAS